MASLAPFRVAPVFKDRPWGARDLRPIYDCLRSPAQAPIGEVWLTGDECRAATGESAGKPLGELAKEFGAEFTGEAAPEPGRFPLLIKFLFPREKLSVQVHPDDAAARAAGEPCGKTECWYALAAEAGAQVALGMKPGVTRAALAGAIAENRAEALLRWLDVSPGDMFYAEAGTVHAIGPGAVLVETQQNSDTTYRLYDYGRGRALRIEQGLAAAKERANAGRVAREPRHGNVNLVTAPYFVVDHYELAARKQQVITRHLPPTSAQVLVALAGSGSAGASAGEPVEFERGQALVIPAAVREFSVKARTQLEYLRMSLPQAATAHPAVT